ncbi:MAG TPA: class I SAM-dependent methyltransferase [Alphaproteobacteria bacterium]
MSRLDSFIRRLEAQRACIDFAARPGNVPEGPIFELGLGNGRTFDHLRERFRTREIFVFDRQVNAHPACVPDADHLFFGDIMETLPGAVLRFRNRVAFVHSDLGSGDAARDRALAQKIVPLLAEAVAPGGLVASDQALVIAGWQALPPPPGIAESRYFLYRKPRA